jgi:hypothetical protein
MWLRLAPTTVFVLFAASAQAQDEKRCVERTPPYLLPHVHTMEAAGCPSSVAWYAIPGVTRFDAMGYIGGASLRNNSPHPLRSQATGPVLAGTFGQDFGGFAGNTGRVFLAPTMDPANGHPIARDYRTDGPHVPNIFAWRPIRKAVIEAKDAHEGKGGHEGK